MAIAVIFTPSSLTVEQYRQAIERLEAAGAGTPPERQYHIAFGTDNVRSFDVWDSPEALEQFGAKLVPILDELGVAPPAMDVSPLQNVIARAQR